MYKWPQWQPPQIGLQNHLASCQVCRLMPLPFSSSFCCEWSWYLAEWEWGNPFSLSLSRSCPADCDWKGFNWALSVYSPNHPDGACRGVLQDGRQIGQDLQTNTFTSFALQPQYVSPSGWSSLRIEWGQRWGRWPVIGGRSHCLLMEWERHLVGMGSQVLLLFWNEKLMRRCVGNQGSGAEVLKKLWCDTAHVEERRDDTLASAPSNVPHQHQTIVTINIKG